MQSTKCPRGHLEDDPFWNAKPVEADQCIGDVFGSPHAEDEPGCSILQHSLVASYVTLVEVRYMLSATEIQPKESSFQRYDLWYFHKLQRKSALQRCIPHSTARIRIMLCNIVGPFQQ